jgi:hypothetical protein
VRVARRILATAQTSSACDAHTLCDFVHEMRVCDVVFVDTHVHHTHSVMLRKQMHSDSHSRSLHRDAPRREGRSMDRMFVEAAPAVTTSPEAHSACDRFPVEMLCIDAGIARTRPSQQHSAAMVTHLRFPVAQAARWRRRGEPVQRGRACLSVTSSRRSLCT